MNRSTKARRAARRRKHEQTVLARLNAASPPRLDGIAAHYDPWGRVVGLGTWALFFASRQRFIGFDRLPNGYVISTVWTGLDRGHFGKPAPLIFESGIFRPEPGSRGLGELIEERLYSTRRQARDGHRALVEEYRRKAAPDGCNH